MYLLRILIIQHMFRKILFFAVCAFQFSSAQVEKPAEWKVYLIPEKPTVGEEATIVWEARLNKGWYMYSLGPYELAPATSIKLESHASFEPIGTLATEKEKSKDDEYIGKYGYFTEKAVFTQKIKIKMAALVIKGSYEYSTCSLESGICLPPREEDFELKDIKVGAAKAAPTKPASPAEASTPEKYPSLPPTDSSTIAEALADTLLQTAAAPIDQKSEEAPKDGLWAFFILALVSGLVALVTPCVFPMIPLTVSFFLHSSKKKSDSILKATLYGLSIIGIYTLIGTLVAKFAGPEAANFLSTHWLPNLFFFGIFVLFALSFLGMFEIVLPSWFVNSIDKQSDRGGYSGIFFMAFTIVLVSFSCTGPIVGTILVESAGGAFIKPMIGMFGFSLAFALPFTLFAIFPSWLKSLPKSGGWLNSVKVTLGFIELGLALKFLSLADQAYHWGILPREINISVWIVLSMALGLYLLHFIRTPHDDADYRQQAVSVPKLIVALISLSFAVYLIPGLVGAPLKPLSGYLPPVVKSTFSIATPANAQPSESPNALCTKAKYSDFLELPHGLQGYFDYQEALECSKKSGKPVFVDFTGHGCVNCREMEANVWSDPKVLRLLQNNFVVTALYVDDKTELPSTQWYTSEYDGKLKSSIGKQNADFQIKKFGANAQPYYVVLDQNGNLLSGPVSYNRNVSEFEAFLREGLDKFRP